MLGYTSLANYYTLNFALVQHHKYSLREIEDLMPWERDVYTDMLREWIAQENEKLQNKDKG
jgi:hypothetical protein